MVGRNTRILTEGDIMKVYLLIYQVGIEHGYEELVGIYTSEENINIAKENHKKKNGLHGSYSVEEVNLNEEINYDMASW